MEGVQWAAERAGGVFDDAGVSWFFVMVGVISVYKHAFELPPLYPWEGCSSFEASFASGAVDEA